jgi:hypothetical protein
MRRSRVAYLCIGRSMYDGILESRRAVGTGCLKQHTKAMQGECQGAGETARRCFLARLADSRRNAHGRSVRVRLIRDVPSRTSMALCIAGLSSISSRERLVSDRWCDRSASESLPLCPLRRGAGAVSPLGSLTPCDPQSSPHLRFLRQDGSP